MRLVEGRVCWSATDLTTAATCEYAVLRRLDECLARGFAPPADDGPLAEQIARVGDRHEAEVRARLEAEAAPFVALPRPPGRASRAELEQMHTRTLSALRDTAGVVFQGGFFDGEFVGFSDFLVATDQGWLVADAKLARQARPAALLQLGAYADQLAAAGLPLSPHARLMLGDGTEDDFPLAEVLPVFRERRARLRALLGHHAEAGPVEWGEDGYVACGHCAHCEQAIEQHRDLLLVAGMRLSQRTLLRDAGARTLDDLAAMTEPPDGMVRPTFDKLVAQARLQSAQLASRGRDGRDQVRYELVDGGRALAKLPDPSPGDLFFDFEGDPLHRESDARTWGLEYLWGVVEAPVDGAEPAFRRWWAHDRAAERQALVEFLDYVAARRTEHPGMHVYHYAPYETTALKRLTGRYGTHQSELDDLLRNAVFVDLYAVVRSSVRVSQPSYSIKRLEPLYMDEVTREGMDVAAGDASIAEYHEARSLAATGDTAAAEARLAALEAYNRYDCVSTLGLRDWLLEVAAKHGVERETDQPAAELARDMQERQAEPDEEDDALAVRLRLLAGPQPREHRTVDEQAFALLASALGYHRRESLPYWWEHFTRLSTPDVHEWRPDRDVFRVERSEVLEGWCTPEGKRTLQRRLRLRGRWGPGSTPGSKASVVYPVPCPEGAKVPEKCDYGWFHEADIEVSEHDEGEVVLVERLGKDTQPHDAVPVALTPAPPPNDRLLRQAVREIAEQVARRGSLPQQPALDVLRRLPPRLTTLAGLPHTNSAIDDLVTTLLDLDRSYVPVQGPPGTGKTFTGSRVIRRLVEEHGWRVGVVAQSHAVVENMLSAIDGAGLDPGLIGKKDIRTPGTGWHLLGTKKGHRPEEFLAEHAGTGCVLGGTAWTFVADGSVARESLDLLVIDEAGQFSLANTLAVSVAAKRLLLLGDPQQLPQVSQGTHDEPVHLSALGWVMDRAETLPRDLGYFLSTTWRMHPALCAKVSALSYRGELGSAPCTAERSLAGVRPGLRSVVVEGAFGNSVASEEEADVVVREARALLGTSWCDPAVSATARPLEQRDILVVAPYNAQVQLVRNRLDSAGLSGVRVGTVDKFQGQEAPVVIVSMTASAPSEVPRGMRFLLDRHRVNVAISRAQWAAVLVRSKELTSYLPGSAHQLLDLGAFIALGDAEA